MKRLQRAGFQLKVQWECAWDKEVKSHPSIQSFLSTMVTTPPLQPRDAFFGGRTGAVSLHHQAGPGEKIYYVDVTSLYPWVNKTTCYPLGHPTIFYEPENQDLDSYFGIALVTIQPPRGLYHPVLPVRHGGKLTFPLCMACVQKEQSKPLHKRSAHCTHTDQERQLQGTWCTPEIQEAIRQKYKLVRIHEVWHFPKSRKGLFKDYVNTWLKIKQESAGVAKVVRDPRAATAIHPTVSRERRHYIAECGKEPGEKASGKTHAEQFLGQIRRKNQQIEGRTSETAQSVVPSTHGFGQ